MGCHENVFSHDDLQTNLAWQFDPNKITEFARGYGKVSSSASAGDVTADTAFMLASVGKVFVASVIAVLLDQGIISSLDEDICETTSTPWASSNACRHPDFKGGLSGSSDKADVLLENVR